VEEITTEERMVPGEYAEGLRTVGEFLDLQLARRVTIVNEATAVALQWHTLRGGAERRRFLSVDLAELSRQGQSRRRTELTARFLRARVTPEGEPQDSEPRGVLFRTLGQDLDREGLQLLAITETATGFRVVGTANGEHVDRFHPMSELAAKNEARRILRRPDAEPADVPVVGEDGAHQRIPPRHARHFQRG
jgi:hypothetical protein